jgi:hypothetical protein
MYDERKLADALINACTLVATDNLKTLCTKYGADVIGFISGCLDKNMKIEAIPALCKFAGLGKYDLVKKATAEFMAKAYPSIYALKCSLGYKLINIMEKRSQVAGEAPMPPPQQGPMPPGPEAMLAQGAQPGQEPLPAQGAGSAGANLPPHVSNLVSRLSDMSVEDLLSTLDELAALGQVVMQGLAQNPQAAQQIGPIGQLVGLGLLGVVQTMTAGQQAAPPSGPAGPAPAPEMGGEAAAPAGPPPGPAAGPAAPPAPPPEAGGPAAGGPGAGETGAAGGGIQLPPGAEPLTFA